MRSISISAEFLSEIERVLAAHAPADVGRGKCWPSWRSSPMPKTRRLPLQVGDLVGLFVRALRRAKRLGPRACSQSR